MAKRDFYEILGVPRGVSPEQIKKAYRLLARKFHPDTAGNDPQTTERFKEAQEAYEVLKDPKKRQAYDRYGHAGLKMDGPGGPGGTAGRTHRWSSSAAGPVNFDFSDIFGKAGGGAHFDVSDIFSGGPGAGAGSMEDIFERLRRRSGRAEPSRSAGPPRGDDIEHTVRLSFEEAVQGAAKDIAMTITQSNGQQHQERLSVKIPAGVDSGSKIRLRGKGQPGPNQKNGDLIIKIEVTPHRYFQRQGEDIYLDLPLTVTEAALGAKVEVPTLADMTTVKIPPASSSGQKLRLNDKGVKSHKTGKTGGMFLILELGGGGGGVLILKIVPPPELDEQSQELFRKLAQRCPQDDIRKDWY